MASLSYNGYVTYVKQIRITTMSLSINGNAVSAVVANGVTLVQMLSNGVAVWASGPTTGLFYAGYNGGGEKYRNPY